MYIYEFLKWHFIVLSIVTYYDRMLRRTNFTIISYISKKKIVVTKTKNSIYYICTLGSHFAILPMNSISF